MKKFLAIVFALIFALSACTVAFAATSYECSDCHAVLADEKAYSAHINGGCLEKFTDCKYCAARVDRNLITDHEDACPKGIKACDYCGEEFTQGELKVHAAEEECICKACGKATTVINNEKTHKCEIADKVVNTVTDKKTWEALAEKAIDALKKVDWKELADKVVGVVKGIDFEGIIAKVKPIIEKVVDLIKNATAA